MLILILENLLYAFILQTEKYNFLYIFSMFYPGIVKFCLLIVFFFAMMIYSCSVPSTIAEGPRQVAGEVNRRVRLQCESEGLPKPRVTWLKNGEPFPVTGLRHTILDKGSLEFVSVQLEDSGDYTCHVSNPAGNVTKNVRLDVQGNLYCIITLPRCI